MRRGGEGGKGGSSWLVLSGLFFGPGVRSFYIRIPHCIRLAWLASSLFGESELSKREGLRVEGLRQRTLRAPTPPDQALVSTSSTWSSSKGERAAGSQEGSCTRAKAEVH